ncbi:hypothetical protein [Anaerovorax odorimutans]|uniref:hypothetical protein n=1 Tax=Anaerovorax odorimutans TaxID=109327 RepID=UPI0004175CB7|nr:hypothetical protein [Anaerovorax odorimutans]
MVKLNKKITENIKTFILVVLSLLTILLLYFFWLGASFDDIRFQEGISQKKDLTIKDVTKPEDIIVCFGGDNFYKIPYDQYYIWDNSEDNKDSIIKELKNFGQSQNIKVQEITEKQYTEVMNQPSIQAKFSYSIPFVDFCKKYGIESAQEYNSIEMMTSIGYSKASMESLFISDDKNQKYYMLISDEEFSWFLKLIDNIKKKGYDAYYPLGIYSGVDNRTIIPLSLNTTMTEFQAKQEIYTDDKDKINSIAEKFFGESFDFTRNIEEKNGNIIFMYGYGDKTLIFKPDGSLEYKEELNEENYSSKDYFESLDIALNFVQTHGTWNYSNGSKINTYVKKVTEVTGKNKGYDITFGVELNGGKLFYENNDIITVKVRGQQVILYKRDMIDFHESNFENSEINQAFSAVNMIAQNTEYIYSSLKNEGKNFETSSAQDIFEDVAKRITKVQVGYIRIETNDSSGFDLKPVWVITIEGINIYFDLYNASPITYSVE